MGHSVYTFLFELLSIFTANKDFTIFTLNGCHFKARSIVCKRLASFLCLGNKSSLLCDDPEDAGSRCFVDHKPTRPAPATLTKEHLSDPVLIDIRDLLQKRVLAEAEERSRIKKEAMMRQGWMFAAEVINRLCFVFFTVILIGTTLVFLVVIRLHH